MGILRQHSEWGSFPLIELSFRKLTLKKFVKTVHVVNPTMQNFHSACIFGHFSSVNNLDSIQLLKDRHIYAYKISPPPFPLPDLGRCLAKEIYSKQCKQWDGGGGLHPAQICNIRCISNSAECVIILLATITFLLSIFLPSLVGNNRLTIFVQCIAPDHEKFRSVGSFHLLSVIF
jgi:hypothetical protein